MKRIFLLFSCLIATNTFAADCKEFHPWTRYDAVVSLPFQNQAANNGEYDDGICFTYDLDKKDGITCTLSNFNVGWMLYSENHLMRDSFANEPFTGNTTVIISNKIIRTPPDKNTHVIHADETGVVAFHHDKNETAGNIATISCSLFLYVKEEQP
jgi:hypothetical protein